MTILKETVINNLSESLKKSKKIIKVGSKVRIDKPTQKGWFWKYGWVAEIRGNEALINYGTQANPIYGMGIWIKIKDLEVIGI